MTKAFFPRQAAFASSMHATPFHPIPQVVDPLLLTILSWPRKHNSASELGFKNWLGAWLSTQGETTLHAEGALSVTVPGPLGTASTTLFSCHTDTIDPSIACPSDPLARKTLTYDSDFGLIALHKDSVGDSLGADDGAGVWLMLRMIEAGVAGTYLFHRGEECGGISAKAIAAEEENWLGQFQACIAFDRPRTDEVITHQGGLRCASHAFASSLCDQLNAHGFDYAPSSEGVYTDNKEYCSLIAECVNLGVGYEDQHGRSETQDYAHLDALRAACLAINWAGLLIEREPGRLWRSASSTGRH